MVYQEPVYILDRIKTGDQSKQLYEIVLESLQEKKNRTDKPKFYILVETLPLQFQANVAAKN